MFNWSSNKQLVCGPTTNLNPSQTNERVGSLVQDLESVVRITSLASLKVGRSEFHLAPYVPSYSPSLTLEMRDLLSRRTRVTLTHANLRIISNKQEFMVGLGLRTSYLGHRMKKSVSTVNDPTRTRYSALSLYYRSFWLYTWTWSTLMSLHIVQIIIL